MSDELDPEAVPDYFSQSGTVERWWSPDTGPLAFHYDAELKVIDDQIAIEQDFQVLDVGTGRGRFAIHMAGLGCRTVASDISSEMLDVARKAARDQGLLEKISFCESSAEDLSNTGRDHFDLVLCMELFDHLPDLGSALSAMRRLLAPGGYFVFTYVPTGSLYGCLGNIYRWVRRRLRPANPMISRTYSRAEIERRLAENGFIADGYFGLGVLCINAQTRLFQTQNPLFRAALWVARAESKRWPYHSGPLLGRIGAHVVGIARAVD